MFLFWYKGQHWGGTGHVTLMYFDIANKYQCFFDPSNVVGRDTLDFFNTHHLWEVSEDATLVVVDLSARTPETLQAFFDPDVRRSLTTYVCHQKGDYADGGGCCSTVVLIVACVCLRFRYNQVCVSSSNAAPEGYNVQDVVDNIRQIIEVLWQSPGGVLLLATHPDFTE